MARIVRTFHKRLSEQGLVDGVLAAGEHTSPTPFQERLSLSREFLSQWENTDDPIRSRAANWYRGFTPKSAALYDFNTYRPADYVSDLHERYCWTINQPNVELLTDKARFDRTLREHGYGSVLPTRFGRIENGTFRGDDHDVATLLRREESLVIKPTGGAGGAGLYLCDLDRGVPQINGTRKSWAVVNDLVAHLSDHLVTEFVRQAAYAESIYPDTPNTIRVLTLNPSSGDPFVARAVHRLGSRTSGHVDNFSRGGLSAGIDEHGILGPAVRYAGGEVSWHARHPDTGSRIDGVRVPGWANIHETVLSIVDDIPAFKYVGWDILCTEAGPRLLEGNANTDTDLLQAHGPLLVDERIRAFYRENGIVP